MTHIVSDPCVWLLRKPWVMVRVQVVDRKTLRIDGDGPNITIARDDTEWAELLDNIRVLDADGKTEIQPSKGRRFFVTVRTINPTHGLTEADPRDMS